jgi:antitoxin YefM
MADVSFSEFRDHLASYVKAVCDDRTPLFVTQPNDRSVVLMSADDYESLMETLYLLDSPANAAGLMRSIQDADEGKLGAHELLEPAVSKPAAK